MIIENKQKIQDWQCIDSQIPSAVYLADAGFEAELEEELTRKKLRILFKRGRLFGTAQAPRNCTWALNTWLQPEVIPIRSIKDGASQLKLIQRNWALFSTLEHRRAALIQDALPKISAKPHIFGTPAPVSPLGSWTLWTKDSILASARCTSPFVNGEIHFEEDKVNPPNRAYLKLWELFTRIGKWPLPGDLCLDLGSSPGGWTWVLASLGANVFSVDKAPLVPQVETHTRVEYCKGSAFAVDPSLVGDVSWLFCDVACYPERLYTMIQKWISFDIQTNIVCTIKFSGKTNFTALDSFSNITGSSSMHLFANKHEVTWIRLVN